MDDLERVAAQNRELREQELQHAEAIVREEIVAYARAKQERTALPVLARLREKAEALAQAEVERTLAVLGTMNERQQKSVRALATAIVNKLLHGPTARLRGEQGGSLADAAAELFGLKESLEQSTPAAPPPAAGHQPPAEKTADVLPITGRK
jgi:glutamyl-tRNA reductase